MFECSTSSPSSSSSCAETKGRKVACKEQGDGLDVVDGPLVDGDVSSWHSRFMSSATAISERRLAFSDVYIYNPTTLDKWCIKKPARRYRSVLAGNASMSWRAWSPVLQSRDFSFIFGVENPLKPGKFLFMAGNDRRHLKLREGVITRPDNVTASDARVFIWEYNAHRKGLLFKHLVTGWYVGRSTRNHRKLKLVTTAEEAAIWIIASL